MILTSITPHGRYAEFSYTGTVDYTGVVRAFGWAHAHCLANALRGALVDVSSAEGTLSPIEQIELTRRLAPGWNRGILLAVVVNAAQHVADRPWQLAAQNRGIRAREFSSREPASSWLAACLRDDQEPAPNPLAEARW